MSEAIHHQWQPRGDKAVINLPAREDARQTLFVSPNLRGLGESKSSQRSPLAVEEIFTVGFEGMQTFNDWLRNAE